MSIQLMIPLDGSEFAEQAVPYALDLAKQLNARIHLVSVFDEDLCEARQAYLQTLAADARFADANPVMALLVGEVVPALEQYAREAHIDLVVMSTHGRGGLQRVWMGSVADAMVRAVNMPVLLLRRDWTDVYHRKDQPRNVLLPVDGSTYSESLIPKALTLAGNARAHYTLLQVLMPPAVAVTMDGGPIPIPTPWEEVRDLAIMHLHELAQSLRDQGYSVDSAIVVNVDVTDAIRSYAYEHGIDLIAMVTHGRRGWKRVALGSVADEVIRATSVPVLVLNPDEDTEVEPVLAGSVNN